MACWGDVHPNVQDNLNSNSQAPVIELLTELLSQQRELVEIQRAHLKLVSAPTAAPKDACELAVDNTGAGKQADATSHVSKQDEEPVRQNSEPELSQKTTKILEIAEWETELHGETVVANQKLPEGVPVPCYMILQLMGVLQYGGTALSCCLRHCFMWASALITCAYSVIVALTAQNSVRIVAGTTGAALSIGVILPGWYTWRNQFAQHGATLSLLQRMAQRQFHWQPLKNASHMFWILTPALCVIILLEETIVGLVVLRHEFGVARFFDSKLAFLGDAVAHHMTNLIVALGTLLMTVEIFFLFGQIWMCHLASHLHCHNVRLYAGAVDRALQGDLDTKAVVSALSKMELSVSADLLRASATWVTFILYEMFVFACLLLVSITLLLRGLAAVGQQHTLPVNILMIFNITVVELGLAWPLAMVKHVYEVDIQLALNNPWVMHKAQKYFASQFISHLKFLEWGFRVGGNTLGSSTFVRVGSSVFVALCIAVSNTAFKVLSPTR